MAKVRKTREQILATNDIREEEIDVPEWETTLKIRGFTLEQRHLVFERATKDGVVDALRATIFAFIEGVVEPRFSLNDYDALRKKSAAVERVALRIHALSGIGQNALEQAVKNSAPTQGDSSSIN